VIATVHGRDSQGLGKFLSSAYAAMAAEVNRSTNLAVECRDRPHYRDPLGPAPLVPIGTAVPTLVLAGEFDPVTRPPESQNVATLINPHARWIEFPRIGHNVRAFSPCGAKIAADFIDNPAQSPETSCADRAAPIRFPK